MRRRSLRQDHTHEPVGVLVEVPFVRAVAPGIHRNPRAHGGTCRTELCSCGATRLVNVNGDAREASTWT